MKLRLKISPLLFYIAFALLSTGKNRNDFICGEALDSIELSDINVAIFYTQLKPISNLYRVHQRKLLLLQSSDIQSDNRKYHALMIETGNRFIFRTDNRSLCIFWIIGNSLIAF